MNDKAQMTNGVKYKMDDRIQMTNTKTFRFLSAILLITLCLLIPSEVYALMPAGKEAAPEEEADEVISEEENAVLEGKIAEEIKRVKEEKRRIIEEVKEKEAFPEFPEPKRPFIADEEVVESRLSKPKAKMTKPLETHNIILGERPILLVLFLLALSVILYYAYKFTIKK